MGLIEKRREFMHGEKRKVKVNVISHIKIFLPNGEVEEYYRGVDDVSQIKLSEDDDVRIYIKISEVDEERLMRYYSGMPYMANFLQVEREVAV